ncbi:MAG: TerC family protein [Caldilineaceae bacterium]
MAEFFSAETLIALATLTALEIVLGIDNVIFIAILSAKLPVDQQDRARLTGIMLAVITRILLLFSITWIMRLTAPLFTIFGNEISGRDLILLLGGLFLIGKSTFEIHEKLEAEEHERAAKVRATFASVVAQIVIIDIVFSLDSVITAVGISGDLWVMVPAVLVAAVVMLVFSGPSPALWNAIRPSRFWRSRSSSSSVRCWSSRDGTPKSCTTTICATTSTSPWPLPWSWN